MESMDNPPRKANMSDEELLTANFEVEEIWTVVCPHCLINEMEAPFNTDNPMQPMKVQCNHCGKDFILTYERD